MEPTQQKNNRSKPIRMERCAHDENVFCMAGCVAEAVGSGKLKTASLAQSTGGVKQTAEIP